MTGAAADDPCMRSAVAMATALRDGRLTSEELVERHLAQIAERDPALGVFVTVAAEEARGNARRRDAERRAGQALGPLHGVPFAVKDVFQTRGLRTTAGSPMLAHWIPESTAEAVRRLEAAGMILLGKTNTHEFAFGVTTQTVYASTRNPHDPMRLAGGSSGGSAAAVAAGMAPIALGTDTAGSIRLPAAWTGTVGFKPSHGRISCEGVVAQSYSADHVGPFSRCATDLLLVMDILAEEPHPDYAKPRSVRPEDLTIGVPDPWPDGAVDGEVMESFRDALAWLGNLGCRVAQVPWPLFREAPEINAAVILAETAARHEQYATEWFAGTPMRYGEDVAELLERGRRIVATDYLRAERRRRQLRAEAAAALTEVDILASPTVPIAAPPVGSRTVEVDGESVELLSGAIRLLCAYSLTGLPALSIPVRPTRSGLPVGLQLATTSEHEPQLMALAALLLGEEAELEQLRMLSAGRGASG